MKILLLGKNGQVGWELQRSLSVLGELISLGRDQADFESPESLRTIIREINPDIIVNAVAYTAVDKAESEPEKAALVNTASVAVLAEEAHRLHAWLIHYSTDYVFDGSKEVPYNEDDLTHPLSVYGQTKRAGEQAIQQIHDKYLIFRTSWVFGVHGNNFAKTMLRLAADREALRIVGDQFGAPTSAAYIADMTSLILKHIVHLSSTNCSGIYNMVAGGKTSWFGYASYVIAQTKLAGAVLKVNDIVSIPTSEYPTPAVRPLNSCLDMNKLSKAFGLVQTSWQSQVDHYLETIRNK